AYPDSQLAFMIEDAMPAVVLAGTCMRARLCEAIATAVPVWPVEDCGNPGTELPGLAITTDPEDPIYVTYTSGSTGRPKGVVVPHRAVVRLVQGQDFCSLGSDEVILQLAPLAFDASTFEIWGALLNGGSLAVVAEERPAIDDVAAALTGLGVTTAWLTAGLFHLMVDARLDALTGLRQLLAGGDVLSPDHLRRFMAAAPQCRMINGYGPTENTTFTCCANLSDGTWPSESAPIGRAIAGTRLWIVDDALQPVSPGRDGQLVTGGSGLALGYLGQEELTAERFIMAPAPIGERIYLTGDLVRELPDGQIEFLGRIDRQVKIDGKRIEPGEIEQALRRCAGIFDAAVVVETTASGIKRLLGFVAVGDHSANEAQALAEAARQALRESLPEFLWPSRVIALAELPITANGKVDRAALLAHQAAPSQQAPLGTSELTELVAAEWRAVLGLDAVGLDEVFFDLGGRSLQLMTVHAALQKKLDRKIPITELFARPTVRRLADWLAGGEMRAAPAAVRQAQQGSGSVAIVAMTGRFPGARSVEEFWANQKAGKVSITHFTDAELQDWFDTETRADPNFVRARGVLDEPGMFDADLFGMYPREAALTDPQHRLFLEIALEALERGGLDPRRFAGQVGVFAGASMPTYLLGHVLDGREAAMEFASNYQLGEMQTLVGSLPDALATRVAYKLDLRGPAITVLSACSTSAVAVFQACQALAAGHCDAALAGGVSITFPQQRGYLYQDGGMGSRDGTCRPLDAQASGTVFGSGAAVVLLKRLEDALADGDTIHAVIRGCGINNDGAAKIGFTGPSAAGQARAIMAAHAQAGIDPASIGYVELHGTATPLGDPIEFEGLVEAFGPGVATGTCALGSAKANIGHLDVAAGVTGLIKAALCLAEEEIPPMAHFTAPNPHIDLAASPFRIERALTPWPRGESPRRAGLSAFGVGGTNVHILLEEAPVQHRAEPPVGLQVLPLSAKTGAALEAQALALADHLEAQPELALADVAFTLAEGRLARGERAAVVAETVEEAVAKLRQLPRRGIKGTAKDAPPVVFMFPGQGSQYPGMGATLYRDEPVYREWIDRGADLLGTRLGQDLRSLLFDLPGGDDEAPHPIRSTVNAQPALFITQHALARLWMARGVRPAAMIGHSVGEFVAATLAGVMDFADALALVVRRAELMQSAPAGAMLAVRTSESELAPLLGPDLDIAAINAPALCVAAGPFEAVAELEARLALAEIDCRRLHTSHAFHSAMMDPVVPELEKLASTVSYGEPTIPYVSCVTGEWAGGASAASGAYWARHCRAPVRFGKALATLVKDQVPVLLEVGPGRALTTFASQGLEKGQYLAAITSMPEFVEAARDRAMFYEAAARLWTCGGASDWSSLWGPQPRRVVVPAYQFQRQNHWIESKPRGEAIVPAPLPALQVLSIPAIAAPTLASESIVTAMTNNTPARPQSRLPRLCAELAGIFEELSGETIDQGDWETPFLELGFDSLFLGQVASKVQRQNGVKVTFRQLMADFPSCDALARHLDAEMPAEAAVVEAVPDAGPVIAAVTVASAAPLPVQAVPALPVAPPLVGPSLV
ncbi:MAG: beta-ketoacyl synthase N-terminal-like domain-containing protein, partial [Croceibacterium sp.]